MLKELIAKLDESKLQTLRYALEGEFTHHVEIEGGLFVGVYVAPQENMEIVESSGVWSCGRIKRNK